MMAAQMKQDSKRAKPRLMEYDVIRVVAMLFVLLLHGMTGVDHGDKYAYFYFVFVQSLCFTCNALFFMLSGRFALKAFEREPEQSFRKYYVHKANTFLLPVLVFFLLRTLYDTRAESLTALELLTRYVKNVTGGYYAGDGWFLYTLTASLAAVPFVARSFCRFSKRQHMLFVAVGMLWNGISDICAAAGGVFSWKYLFGGWPFYFFLGYSIEKLITEKKQIRLLWVSGAICFVATIVLSYKGTKLALHDASPIFTVLAASVYYACRELGKAIDRRHIKWMQNTIAFLAKHSFSVYMSHGVLMQIVVGWREYWPMHVFSVFTSWDTVLKTLCLTLAAALVMDHALLPLIRRGGRACAGAIRTLKGEAE